MSTNDRRPGSRWERGASVTCLAVGVLLLFVAAGVALSQGGLVRSAYLSLVAGVALVVASVIIDPRSALDLARDRRARFGVMSVLVSSFVIGILLTRSLVGPLRRLVGEATQVSTGNIDLREAHFDTRSGDDITHEVASAFDRMLNALRFYALADEAGSGGEE